MKKLFFAFVLLLTAICVISCSAPADDGDKTEDINPDSIQVESVLGLNEQIYLTLTKGEYVISYKASDAEEYALLDKELMLENGEKLDCYILGLAKGIYDVKIEQGEGENYACKVLPDIDVEKQDRSGYAHFGREDGIGGYNNDGTVKDGAKIIYVSNETKNTVTLDINGTTYTGLVAILQANRHMEDPLIIRVLDKITTNQWVATSVSPGLSDYSSVPDGYYESIFSDQYGENLAGLPVWIDIGELDTRYKYATSADGIVFADAVPLSPLMDGNSVTGCMMNMLEVINGKDITIEGVGTKAELFQFGIAFEYCSSIEIKNLIFSKYPVDGLSIKAADEVADHGWVWIHNNTFNAGYSSFWYRINDSDYKGEYNSGGYGDADGDESIDLRDVRNFTFSYNKFFKTGKTIILGGWEYDVCMNMTFHHNFYLLADQRLPLSRNSNIHNYNNYFADCKRGLSPRTSTYVFSEANYFDGVGEAYYFSSSETQGAIKSFGDMYRNTYAQDVVTKVTERDAIVENTCKADWVTDHSKFDTDPALFYYDVENKCSDVELMHEAKDVPSFVPKYAGAGILTRMEFPSSEE